MTKQAIPKTFERTPVGGFRYSRNPPDVVGPSAPTFNQAPVPGTTSITATWVNGTDTQSGIASSYAEVSPHGANVWTRTVVPFPGASVTFSGLSSSTPYDIRVANVDASANSNVSAYSGVQLLSTVGSAADLEPGTIALAVASITVNENAGFSVGILRTGAGILSPSVTAQWAISGLTQGTPSPSNGPITWAAGENGVKFISATAGALLVTQTGVLRIVSLAQDSGNIAPTLGSPSQAALTVISTDVGGIKWNPGFYAGSQNPTYADDRKLAQQQAEQALVLSSGANVLGLEMRYYTGIFGNTPGVWDFSKIVRDLNILRNMSPPKRLMIDLTPQVFGLGAAYADILPAYVYNDSSYGPSPIAGKYGWWSAKGSTETSIAYWRPAVMDWIISMFQALASTVNSATGLTFDLDPYVEQTTFCELALGMDPGDATFTTNSRVTQYKRLIDAINIAWPHTLHVCKNNYAGSQALSQELTDYCLANRTAQGGPDTYAIGQKEMTWGQRAAIGVAQSDPDFVGPDLRGLIAMRSETQGPETSNPARYTMYTPHSFFTAVNTLLQQSHMIITMVNRGVTSNPIPAYPADGINTGANPGNWNSFMQVINGNTLTHIQKPSSLITTPVTPPSTDPFAFRAPLASDKYVSASAPNDTGAGTIANPWKTITQARYATLVAGQAVWFRAGTYTWPDITSAQNGTLANRIVTSAYPGEPVTMVVEQRRVGNADYHQWRNVDIQCTNHGIMLANGFVLSGSGISRFFEIVDCTGTRNSGSETDNSGLLEAYGNGSAGCSAVGVAPLSVIRCRFTGPSGLTQNQSLILLDYVPNWQFIGTFLDGSANPFYLKHTNFNDALNQSGLVKNCILSNAGRGCQAAMNYVQYLNNGWVRANLGMDESGGGISGGNNCTISHNTFLLSLVGAAITDGGTHVHLNNVLRNQAWIGSGSEFQDNPFGANANQNQNNNSDYSAGDTNTHFYRDSVRRTILAYHAAYAAQEANGLQGTIALLGGTNPGSTPTNWALVPGSVGIGNASDGGNRGVDATKLLTVN